MLEKEFETQINSELNNNSENEEKASKHKSKKIIFSVILAIVAAIFCVHYFVYSTTIVSTDDAFVEGHNIPISPKVSGNILKVHFDDNQEIKKGQLLVEIDPVDYEVKYEQAMAKLQAAIEKYKGANANVSLTSITSDAAAEQASSAVEGLKSSVKVADKQISQAKANLAQANNDIASVKAEYNLVETDFSRYQKLYKKGAVSKQDFDRVSTNYKSIKAKLDSANEKASAAQAMLESAYANKEVAVKNLDQAIGKLKSTNTVAEQVSISNAQSRVAAAEIKQLQTSVKQAKLELSYTKIYAPNSGVITNKTVEEGAYIQIGQPLFSIVPDERWIIANFKETQLTNMKKGQLVYIKVDSYPNKVFKGQIDSIQASTGSASSLFPPENAVGSFVKVVQRIPVKITFSEKIDPEYAIVPGMSVIPEVKVK